MKTRHLRGAVAAASIAAGLTAAGPAFAHPHVFIDAKASLVFDAGGRLEAVRHVWRFDDAYSAFASQGLDTDGDGTLSVDELKPLADVNIESLVEFDFFTYLTVGDREVSFATPTEYWLQSDDGRLTLYLTLAVEKPAEIRSLPARVDVYDPTFYVSFGFVEDEPVALENPPAGCTTTVERPTDLDPTVAASLAEIGPEQRDLPAELLDITRDLTNGVTLSCP